MRTPVARRREATLVWVVGLALGCGRVSEEVVDAEQPPTDALGEDTHVDASGPPGPWQPPVPIASVNTSNSDRTPWLSADGLTLYFSSNHPVGKTHDIRRAVRSSIAQPFQAAVSVTALNTTWTEEAPFVAASGKRIWFSRTVATGTQILVATGSSGVWNEPSLVAEVSTSTVDGMAMVQTDGSSMYLMSRRGANGDADIYVSTWSATVEQWLAPTTTGLGKVNSPALDLHPHVSSDGLRLYLTSSRDGMHGIYVAARATPDDDFGTPAPISELNTVPIDGGFWISDDERHMILGRGGDLHETRR